ncbi:MAG: hypothetical protein JXQ73_04865 [Phycisphaerae bacterium]|nr:hypothetical protein [Phycisphaerae bacterium]
MPTTLPCTSGVIERNVSCVFCDYNLRGLPADGRCPECGRQIADSTKSDLLSLAHPRWVKRIRIGAAFMLVGLVLMALLWGVTAFGYLLRFMSNFPPAFYGAISGPFRYLGVGVFALGVWLLATPDPREVLDRRVGWVRMLCRSAIGLEMISFGWVYATQFSTFQTMDPESHYVVAWLLSILTWVLLLMMPFLYIGQLARRMPDNPLRRRSQVCAIAACSWLFQAIPYALGELDLETGRRLSPAWDDPSASLPAGIWEILTPTCDVSYWVLSAVFNVLAIIVAWKLRGRMRKIARHAKAYAAQEDLSDAATEPAMQASA